MESQKPKIAMYVKRPFGEKLNASFDFIKENWKQLFKYSTYLILPICLIQAANFSGLMGSMTDITAMQASGGISDNPLAALGPSFALNYAGVIFFSCNIGDKYCNYGVVSYGNKQRTENHRKWKCFLTHSKDSTA